MNHRIRQIRENLHLSRTEFGQRIGVSGDVINNLERGRVEIKDHIVKLICCEYNINETWLRTGNGDADKPISREGELAKYMELLLQCEPNDIRRRFVLAVSHLSSDQLDVFSNIARQLANDLKPQPDASGKPNSTESPSGNSSGEDNVIQLEPVNKKADESNPTNISVAARGGLLEITDDIRQDATKLFKSSQKDEEKKD